MESNTPSTDRGESNDDQPPTPPYRVGDHVTDREEDEEKPMLVVSIPGHTAREYRVEGVNKTVAELNPDYPKADEVVEVVFARRTDSDLGNKKRYAYPSSRLELRHSIHPSDEESGEPSCQQTLDAGDAMGGEQ